MPKTHLIILDVQYLFCSASFAKKWLDLVKLCGHLRERYQRDGMVAEIRAYLLNNKSGPSPVEKILMDLGVEVSVKCIASRVSQVSQQSHDVKITLDVADRLSSLDVLVLCSGKASFTDLVQRCHMYKKEVHVWGFGFSLARLLTAACDQVFHVEDLDVLQESRRV